MAAPSSDDGVDALVERLSAELNFPPALVRRIPEGRLRAYGGLLTAADLMDSWTAGAGSKPDGVLACGPDAVDAGSDETDAGSYRILEEA